MRIRFYILSMFLFLFGGNPGLSAQLYIGDDRIDTSSLAMGLDTPWEILCGPDDHIWFTERPGRVSRLNPENGEKEILLTIPEVYEVSESGYL